MKEPAYRSSERGKKELRRLSRIAHERALRVALEKLEAKFSLWHSGKLDTFALNDAIHEYHQNDQRELWSLYQPSMASAAVARAVAEGLLKESELSPRLLADLVQSIAYFRET